jgi:hypothetical protein
MSALVYVQVCAAPSCGSFVGQKPGSTLFKQPAIAVTGSFTCGS